MMLLNFLDNYYYINYTEDFYNDHLKSLMRDLKIHYHDDLTKLNLMKKYPNLSLWFAFKGDHINPGTPRL